MLKKLYEWATVRKEDEGVTLIELLAVIVILAIIAAIAIPVVLGSINNAKVNTTEQDLSIISEALNRYEVVNNQYPTTTSATPITLQGSGSSASGSGGDTVTYIPENSTQTATGTLEKALAPYLATIPADGWGNAFTYSAPVATAPASPTYTVATQKENGLYYYVTNASGVTDGTVAP